MDPLTRKLFQPREAREKLRGMGGIMSSSPQLASTVAKFQQGGPIQSRGLAMPSAPDAPLPSAGRARATRVGDRTFVLTEDGRVLDAQTGAPAPQEVAAEVMRRLNPQLSMADIVGAAPDFSGGVNPSFREDTSGQLPPMPSDLAPMSEPAMPADPAAEFDMGAFQRDLTGAGRAVAGPGLMAIDELSYDGPLISPVQPPRTPREDTHSADLRAAIEAAQAGGPSVDAPSQVIDEFSMMPYGNVGNESVPELAPRPDRPAPVIDEFMPYGNVGNESVPELAPVAEPGAGSTAFSDALRGRPGNRSLDPFSGGETEVAAPVVETPVVETPVADTPVADTPPPAPTLDVDLDDPDTYDTNFDEMMRRLGGATGKDDKSSRQKAMADLAMIGLAIAAGQSPDALTNIAQGALTGMKAIRAEDAATSAADRETRLLAERLAADRSNLDREIASRERIAGMNLEGRGDSYAKLLLEQTNKIMQTGQVDIADAMTQAREQLAAAGLSAPLGAEQRVGIQTRVDAAKNDPEALAAIRNSLIVRGISPADFGV